MKKAQKGITLVALIITVIVMLILVAVTINVAVNGGLFTRAKNASRDTQKQADREELMSAVFGTTDNNGNIQIAKDTLESKLSNGWEVDSTTITDSNNKVWYKCTSPKGNVFYINKATGKIEETEPSGTVVANNELQLLRNYFVGNIATNLIVNNQFIDGSGNAEGIIGSSIEVIGNYGMTGVIIQYSNNKRYLVTLGDEMLVLAVDEYNFDTVESGDFKYNIDLGENIAILAGLSEQGKTKVQNSQALETTALETVPYNGTNYTVTKVGTMAFSGCSSLALSSLPSGITTIEPYAFSTCTNLALTSLPSGATNIDEYAFFGCESLALTSLPSNTTTISGYEFYGCTSLNLASLPSGITSIGRDAFYNCSTLALTSLPAGITSIGIEAFDGCTNLALTSLPEGITTIENRAFDRCKNLALESLPSGVTSIGPWAFYECEKLEFTSLPSGITSIEQAAFSKCTNLALTSLPNGITEIGYRTFWHCENIVLQTLPDGVTSIGQEAFEGCTKLALTSLPSSLTSIGSKAFGQCSHMTFTTLPSGVTSIGNQAFYYTYKHLDLSNCPYLSPSSENYPWGLSENNITF